LSYCVPIGVLFVFEVESEEVVVAEALLLELDVSNPSNQEHPPKRATNKNKF
jgi:hypothetical protein